MQDQIGELLDERARGGAALAATTVVSILLHLAMALPLVLAVTRKPDSQPTPVRVRLQQASVPRPAAPAPSVPASTPLPDIPATTPPAVEPLPPAQPKPATREVDRSLFGRSPEKPAEKPAETPPRAVPGRSTEPAAPSPGAQSAISVAGGSAAISSFDGVDFPFPLYVDRMLSLIARRWFRPQTAPGEPVTIHFVIDRDGRVRDVEVTRSSGSSNFDRAARRAVIDASPLPPLPFEYLGTDLGVHLQFN